MTPGEIKARRAVALRLLYALRGRASIMAPRPAFSKFESYQAALSSL